VRKGLFEGRRGKNPCHIHHKDFSSYRYLTEDPPDRRQKRLPPLFPLQKHFRKIPKGENLPLLPACRGFFQVKEIIPNPPAPSGERGFPAEPFQKRTLGRRTL